MHTSEVPTPADDSVPASTDSPQVDAQHRREALEPVAVHGSEALDKLRAALQGVYALDDGDPAAHVPAFDRVYEALQDRLAQAED